MSNCPQFARSLPAVFGEISAVFVRLPAVLPTVFPWFGRGLGAVWRGFGAVWRGFGAVWRGLGAVWRGLALFGAVWHSLARFGAVRARFSAVWDLGFGRSFTAVS